MLRTWTRRHQHAQGDHHADQEEIAYRYDQRRTDKEYEVNADTTEKARSYDAASDKREKHGRDRPERPRDHGCGAEELGLLQRIRRHPTPSRSRINIESL